MTYSDILEEMGRHGMNAQKVIEYKGPIVKLGLNTFIDFNKDTPVTFYFVDKEKN